MVDSFAPAVIIDGETIYPKGYEWVLGFALGGCKWAIDKADTEEFRQLIREDLERQAKDRIANQIKYYESETKKLKLELNA